MTAVCPEGLLVAATVRLACSNVPHPTRQCCTLLCPLWQLSCPDAGTCMEHLVGHADPPVGASFSLLPLGDRCQTNSHLVPSVPPRSSAAAAAATLQVLPQQTLNLTTCPLHLLRLLQQLRRLAAGSALCLPWPALHGCLSLLQRCIPLPADMLGLFTQGFQRSFGETRPSGCCSSQ